MSDPSGIHTIAANSDAPATIRDRLLVLATPLGIVLPEAYISFMENRPIRGIRIRHLCNRNDPPTEWWPVPVELLESDIHRGRWKKIELFAHYMRATADDYLAGGWSSLPGPGESRFETERLRHGFWIGEEDGDSVFIDQETLGVFAYLSHEDCVEQWADSFADFVTNGQTAGRFV